MKDERGHTKVLCMGELLWDMIPTGKMIGGAPFNVAYHLHKLGVDTRILTRIGDDIDGMELLDFLSKNNINSSLIQIDKVHATSKVEVYYDDKNSVKYDIVYPTAWDFLELPSPLTSLEDADYLVFGSLIFRHDVSRDTLLQILDKSRGTRIFDVNLRAPHFSREGIFQILGYTDILKLNEDELSLISDWLGNTSRDISYQTDAILDTFDIQELVLTLGANGAMHKGREAGETYFCQAQRVQVVDTIGSGDSFLAAFIASRIQGKPIRESLHAASVLAAFVTSQKGGCPVYSQADLNYFEWHNALL